MQNAVLFLADISGYTKYMLSNRQHVAHATMIIQSLMEALIGELRSPFVVQEIEGDAIFVSATEAQTSAETPVQSLETKPGTTDASSLQQKAAPQRGSGRAETLAKHQAEILRLCQSLPLAFHACRDAMVAVNPCHCEACKGLQNLQIKLIVHTGEVATYETAGFRKVSGVDVILVHRLLKNEVQGNHYVLFSDQAWQDLKLEGLLPMQASVEEAEGLGRIPIRVYYPEGAPESPQPGTKLRPWDRMVYGFRLIGAELGILLGLRKAIDFGAPKEAPAPPLG